MSKNKSTTQRKVTLDELSHHAITNKRQVMKDIKQLDFSTLEFKTPLRNDFTNQYLRKISRSV